MNEDAPLSLITVDLHPTASAHGIVLVKARPGKLQTNHAIGGINPAIHVSVNQAKLELTGQVFRIVMCVGHGELEGKVTFEMKDYRDLEGEAVYDKLASVGMFEHVGLKDLPAYFSVANRLLKPGGLFLNHGITSDEGSRKNSIATEFINRYVFPDGQLETISTVQRLVENAKFEIQDVEGLRPHYALTLREWVNRLERRHEEALKRVPESAYRIWRFYMAACAVQFGEGNTRVLPVLTSRRVPFPSPVPLSRRDLYDGDAKGKGGVRMTATGVSVEGMLHVG